MSGGSFNYLTARLQGGDLSDAFEATEDLAHIRDELLAEFSAVDAAKEIEQILLALQQCEALVSVRVNRLADLLHAFEWYRSSDWSREKVVEALDAYRADPATEPKRGDEEKIVRQHRGPSVRWEKFVQWKEEIQCLDSEGNPITLEKLCVEEPAWAASQIRALVEAGLLAK